MREHTIVTISRQYGSMEEKLQRFLQRRCRCAVMTDRSYIWQREKIGNGDLDVESILEEAYKVPGSHSGFFWRTWNRKRCHPGL